jgi:tetratricopeptide (TPR) repeat protein
MAFGFGFNKQKVLSAAEKFVQQGKLQNAITEYEKILKSDPKDLTVMNTVGDLYARLGNNEKAVECFKNVGDAYASQGFTVKAIAMYKKLGKLKTSLESVLRLAELYTQQGLFNDARAQYLQVAEEFLRDGQLEQAVRIFQKTLEMDPENVTMRTKLAEVYVRLNKKTEAWQIFSAAAETLRSKGQLDAAEEILQRMLKLDPNSSYALLLRGRNAFDAGDMATAIKNLEKVADLDSNPDGLRTLMQAYVQAGRLPQAGTLAVKLVSVHNDITAAFSYADALIAAGQFDEALQVYQQHCERLLAADSAKVLETLHSLISHIRENTAALQTLLELLQKAGDTSHLTEVYELLAHACVQSGELEKARDFYLKLTQLEPENQLHAHNYQQVLGKLGTGSGAHMITAEEGAVLVDELEATSPFIDQRYTDEVALAVRAALTDAELFISYNMPAKALGPLLSALPQAPRDLRVNQKLASLHTRAGRFTEAAVCCRTLEGIYHEAGYPDEAAPYGELAGKYEERAATMPSAASDSTIAEASASPEEVEVAAPATEASTFVVAPAAVPEPVAAEPEVPAATGPFFHTPAAAEAEHGPAEFEVQAAPAAEEEIDLSAEWEGASSSEPAPAAAVDETVEAAGSDETIAEVIEEIRFYLTNSMTEEAGAALRRLEDLKADPAKLAELRAEFEAARTHAPASEPAEEVSVEESEGPVEVESAPAMEPDSSTLGAFVKDLEASVGDELLQQSAKEEAPAPPAGEPEEVAVEAVSEPQPSGTLDQFVSDLEESLGDKFLAQAPIAEAPHAGESKTKAQPQAAAPTPAPAAMAAAAAQFGPAPEVPSAPPSPTRPAPVRPSSPAGPAASDGGAGVDLAGMFGELKQELEEDSVAADEDPETHYNLGVAFREMGLLDEAIAELQKVCQAADRGRPLPQIMQTYTWLAQCFLDKGIPEAAIRWYQQALKLPSIDQDTRTALHYELGSSYEAAGNKTDALNHFMEVYGHNIDYRDVAERVKTLKS